MGTTKELSIHTNEMTKKKQIVRRRIDGEEEGKFDEQEPSLIKKSESVSLVAEGKCPSAVSAPTSEY